MDEHVGAWIQADFGKSITITSVKIMQTHDYEKSARKITISFDNNVQRTAELATDFCYSGWDDISLLDPVESKTMKITFDKMVLEYEYDVNYSALLEVEIYGCYWEGAKLDIMADEAEQVPVPVPVEEEKINDINDAIKSVIRKSQINGGLVKGLNEVCKALDRKQALLCVLAKDCDDTKYKKLIEALAKSNGIPLINVEAKMDLGEWLGHCKYDKEHNPRKVKATSSVAVVEYGEESEALSFVINYIKENSLWTVNSN